MSTLGDQPVAARARYGPFAAVLFDCDGVLVDSQAICRETWTRWLDRVGIEDHSVVEALEGRPIREAMAELIPAGRLDREVDWFSSMELRSASGVRAVPGAGDAVRGLLNADWAVVTSASRALARARLAAAGLPCPRVMIAADDVAAGKPAPDCYRLAARRLGVPAGRCVVLEDSGAGARAAALAGATVLGVGAGIGSSRVHIGPVADLRAIELHRAGGRDIRLNVHENSPRPE
ncbi:HAD-IA family hydrolase [Actinomadura graeca]|uniref:HAD-IA family hydrolase n=1 Tax=Actinomadura graeca TaxID=2750812 RepID=A0ABX8QRD0_9ACTN|nr:HAD-IA family hydrolase [Actinomadura graeca]QXJ21256.1 HAD-IA family hydrolase [Actinomadura graeca]